MKQTYKSNISMISNLFNLLGIRTLSGHIFSAKEITRTHADGYFIRGHKYTDRNTNLYDSLKVQRY